MRQELERDTRFQTRYYIGWKMMQFMFKLDSDLFKQEEWNAIL